MVKGGELLVHHTNKSTDTLWPALQQTVKTQWRPHCAFGRQQSSGQHNSHNTKRCQSCRTKEECKWEWGKGIFTGGLRVKKSIWQFHFTAWHHHYTSHYCTRKELNMPKIQTEQEQFNRNKVSRHRDETGGLCFSSPVLRCTTFTATVYHSAVQRPHFYFYLVFND